MSAHRCHYLDIPANPQPIEQVPYLAPQSLRRRLLEGLVFAVILPVMFVSLLAIGVAFFRHLATPVRVITVETSCGRGQVVDSL